MGYNVEIMHGQLKEGVSPDEMRLPLWENQSVDVYARKKCGFEELFSYTAAENEHESLKSKLRETLSDRDIPEEEWRDLVQVVDAEEKSVDWKEDDIAPDVVFPVQAKLTLLTGVWKPGLIDTPQTCQPTTVGYRVKLVDQNVTVDRVPALRLRSRFTPGMQLDVYRGYEEGWVRGTVHSSVPTDAEELGKVTPRKAPISLVDVREHSSGTSPSSPQRGGANADSARQSNDSSLQIERWVKVPVVLARKKSKNEEETVGENPDMGEQKDDDPELIPSYLLRPRRLLPI